MRRLEDVRTSNAYVSGILEGAKDGKNIPCFMVASLFSAVFQKERQRGTSWRILEQQPLGGTRPALIPLFRCIMLLQM